MAFITHTLPPYLDDMTGATHPLMMSFNTYQTITSWQKKGTGPYTPFTLKKTNPSVTV
jgi:hypothetical protein